MSDEARTRVLTGIREVAREHLGWSDELPKDARLREDLELDSIQLLTLAVEVENFFRVRLEPEDEQEIETVADLVDVVTAKVAGREPGDGG
jgi:acyl carrier protein